MILKSTVRPLSPFSSKLSMSNAVPKICMLLLFLERKLSRLFSGGKRQLMTYLRCFDAALVVIFHLLLYTLRLIMHWTMAIFSRGKRIWKDQTTTTHRKTNSLTIFVPPVHMVGLELRDGFWIWQTRSTFKTEFSTPIFRMPKKGIKCFWGQKMKQEKSKVLV